MHAIFNHPINRRHFTALLTGVCFPAFSLPAQEALPGFFRIINATGLDGKVSFELNKEKLNEAGYGPGEETGSGGFKSGPHEIVAKHPLWGDVSLSFDNKASDHTAIVLYSRVVKDENGEEKKRVLKFTQLSCKPEQNARIVTLTSASPDEEIQIDLDGTPLVLKSLEPRVVNLSKKAGQFVKVTHQGKVLGSLHLDQAGAFGVVIFDKSDGQKGCATYFEIGE